MDHVKHNLFLYWSIVFLALSFSLNAIGQPEHDWSEQDRPRPGPVNFSTPPSSRDEAIDQLRRMIKEAYASWTGSENNPLTIRKIGQLQRNPNITGGQAVLLGVLALTIDHAHGFIDRLSFDSIMELAATGKLTVRTNPNLAGNSPHLDEPDTFTFRNVVINYHKLFENLVSNTTPDGFKLWGREKGPTVDGVQQGPVGNCYWLAAVEAVVLKRPEVIAQSIRQIGPNRYELNFRGRPEPIVVTLTHGAMSQLNLDPHEGCWLSVLALGEARIRDASNDVVNFWRETPLGVVAHSGSQEQVLESLLGQKYKSLRLRRMPRRVVAEMLERATRENMPIGFGAGDHCLSLADYNPETRMLTILNPWGCSMKYTIEGTDLTVEMDRGFFDISLADACRSFLTLSVPSNYVRP